MHRSRSKNSRDSSSDSDEADYAELPDPGGAAGPSSLPTYLCLFCDHVASRDASDLIDRHVPAAHEGLRIADFLATAGLRDQSEWVRLVAFLRGWPPQAAAATARQRLDKFLTSDSGDWSVSLSSEKLSEDPLMYEVDIDDLLAVAGGGGGDAAKDTRIRELEAQVAALRDQASGMSALIRRLAGCQVSEGAAATEAETPATVAELGDDEDGYYVDSYGGASIHAEMLLDRVRTGAYHDFISANPDLFKDRLVLDVGCGSGILSMFAARSGARVLAVDCADVIEEALAAAAENGLADRISFHRGKLERIGQLRGANADAIVSEWMGYFLLYEGMIESVAYARDHCLRQGGSVYPRLCSLRLCGIDSPELYDRRVMYFDNVYGVKVSYLKERGLSEAHVAFDLQPDWVATDAPLLREFDMLRVKPEDTRFASRVRLTAARDCCLHALVGYFDVAFLGDGDAGVNVTFGTGPLAEAGLTHWGQTVFCLRRPLRLVAGESVELGVTVGQPEGHPRGLVVGFELPDCDTCWYSMK